MRVGIVGCGVISNEYVRHAGAFPSFELVACADVVPAQAAALAAVGGFEPARVDELLADPSIDVVLNLTPAEAHAEVVRQALAAGKHVYTEKPLATDLREAASLVELAAASGLRLGCAPDIFLRGAFQAARALIDDGAIGEPLSVSAAMLAGGQSAWHPNPDIFYVDGAGPLFDMGPYYLSAIVALVGPIRQVAGFASTRTVERVIELGPRAGERFRAATPTHTSATMLLAGGATANLVASFEAPGQYVCDLHVHGSEGALALPDPNGFAGPVRLRRGAEGPWEDVSFASRGAADARGLGLHDMVESLAAGLPHRASAELGLHVVEVARAILQAGGEGRTIGIDSHPARPAPLPVASGV
jgi:predicted dehydrogenase